MTLDEQKNIFLQTDKAKKAVAYAQKWFNDFNTSKLEAFYLLMFYQDSVAFSQGAEELDWTIETSYDALFWYWFHARYNRIMNEQAIYEMNIEYEKLMAELDNENFFDWIGLGSIADYLPWILAGGFGLVLFFGFKK